jgi:hypothetical protein
LRRRFPSVESAASGALTAKAVSNACAINEIVKIAIAEYTQ